MPTQAEEHNMHNLYGKAAACAENGDLFWTMCNIKKAYGLADKLGIQRQDMRQAIVKATKRNMHTLYGNAAASADNGDLFWTKYNIEKAYGLADKLGIQRQDMRQAIVKATKRNMHTLYGNAAASADNGDLFWTKYNIKKAYGLADKLGIQRQDMRQAIVKATKRNMHTLYGKAAACAENGDLFWTECNIKEADGLADKLGIQRQDMRQAIVKATKRNMHTLYGNAAASAENGDLFWTEYNIKEADGLADKLGIQRQDMRQAIVKATKRNMHTLYGNAAASAENGDLFWTECNIKKADGLADKLGIQHQDMTQAIAKAGELRISRH